MFQVLVLACNLATALCSVTSTDLDTRDYDECMTQAEYMALRIERDMPDWDVKRFMCVEQEEL